MENALWGEKWKGLIVLHQQHSIQYMHVLGLHSNYKNIRNLELGCHNLASEFQLHSSDTFNTVQYIMYLHTQTQTHTHVHKNTYAHALHLRISAYAPSHNAALPAPALLITHLLCSCKGSHPCILFILTDGEFSFFSSKIHYTENTGRSCTNHPSLLKLLR